MAGRAVWVAAAVAAAAVAAVPSARAVGEPPAPVPAASVAPLPARAGTAAAVHGPFALDLTAAPPAPVELSPALFTSASPDQRAAVAVAAAMAQIGLPYVWGGDGPTAGDAGFDCSGLTTYAYAQAGIRLPRTAHTQYYHGPHVPAGASLQPGDLLFYGTPSRVHHVGMYIGDGRMVNAPTFGKPVRVAYYRWRGDDYLGATRPASTGTPVGGLLPLAPLAVPPVGREPFVAPPAPLPRGPLPQPGDPAPPEGETAAAVLDEIGRTAPATPVPGTTAPGTTSPGTTAPGTTVPETTAPGTTLPGTTAPGTTVPETTAPVTTLPGTTAPGTTAPGTTAPATTSPGPTAEAAAPVAPSPAAADPPSAPADKAAAAEPVRARLPWGTVGLTPVGSGDPLPPVPAEGGGVRVSGTRTVVTVADPALLGDGGRVTLRLADGTSATHRLVAARAASAAAAADLLAGVPAGGLAVLAPTGDGGWLVLLPA